MSVSTTPRWLIIAMVVSLILNLLLIGFVLGAKLRGGPPAGAMLHNSAFSVGRAIRQFDEPRREQLWPLARPHFQSLRTRIRQLRTAQQRWEAAYTAEPVDLAELDASHAALVSHVEAIQRMNFDAMRALATELQPAERVALFNALRKPRHRPRHGPDHKRRPASGQRDRGDP